MPFLLLRAALALASLLGPFAAMGQIVTDPAVADAADLIRALGRVIAPEATRKVYAPLQPAIDAAIRIERDIAYGAAGRQLLDVFAPATPAGPLPVLVFVHGGGFTAGDRRVADSPFFDNIGGWAARQGMVGVNMTYRLAPQDPWPAGADDVGLALRWVLEHIAARGGDPTRIFLLGHSSGATHAATHLVRERCGEAPCPRLAGALLLSGIYQISADARLPPNMVAYFGTEPQKWPERAPYDGLARVSTPLWVGYAELDTPITETQSLRLNDALCRAGRCPVLARFAAHNHMSVAYSIGSTDRVVGQAMLQFMAMHRRSP